MLPCAFALVVYYLTVIITTSLFYDSFYVADADADLIVRLCAAGVCVLVTLTYDMPR